MQLDKFYELTRKGRMAEYLADFLQVYADAQIGAGLQLDDSSLTWHLLKEAHISHSERHMLMMQVGGNYHRFQDIFDLLAKVLPYDKSLNIAYADGSEAGNQQVQPPQPVMMAQPAAMPQPLRCPCRLWRKSIRSMPPFNSSRCLSNRSWPSQRRTGAVGLTSSKQQTAAGPTSKLAAAVWDAPTILEVGRSHK